MSKGKALLYAYGISSFSNFNGAPPLKQVMKIPPLLRRDRDAIGRACAGRRLEWLGCVKPRLKAPPDAKVSDADLVEAHLGKGYDALKQDRYDLAASEFRAALDLDPTLVLRARFPLAVALFELHKSDEARKELEAVRREAGDHPNVLYHLGRLDLADRKFESAIRNLNKAAAKPPFPDTAYYLGFAYFKRGDLPAAEKWLEEAAQANPRDASIPLSQRGARRGSETGLGPLRGAISSIASTRHEPLWPARSSDSQIYFK